jgi:putative ABC transport system permease protein
MTLIQLTLKNLTRRPTRTGLTIMGIGVGIGAVVALLGLAWGMSEGWATAQRVRGTDVVVRNASGGLMAQPFDQGLIEQTRRSPHVELAAGTLTEVLSVEEAPMVVVSGREWGSYLWQGMELISGRLPKDGQEKAVVLGTLAAEMLQKKVGDKLTIEVEDFDVVGIADSKAVVENGSVFLSLEPLQQVMQKEGKVNFVNLRLKNRSENLEQVAKELASAFPDYRVETASELAANNDGVKTFEAMNWATSVVALLVGTFGVMNTMFMSVFERTREIGVLIALGWRRGRILRMIIYESLALCAAAGVLGILFGIGLLQAMYQTHWMKGKLEPYMGLDLIGLAMLLAIGVGLLSGIYPALRCTRINPSIALRQ